jgi:hypothetical protein
MSTEPKLSFESILDLQQEALTKIHNAKRTYILQEGWTCTDEMRWSKGPFSKFSIAEAFDVEVRYKRDGGKFPTRLKSKEEEDED